MPNTETPDNKELVTDCNNCQEKDKQIVGLEKIKAASKTKIEHLNAELNISLAKNTEFEAVANNQKRTDAFIEQGGKKEFANDFLKLSQDTELTENEWKNQKKSRPFLFNEETESKTIAGVESKSNRLETATFKIDDSEV